MKALLACGIIGGMIVAFAAMAAQGADQPSLEADPTVVGVYAPSEYDLDEDHFVTILDITKVARYFTWAAQCVVRSTYPTPPADGVAGCDHVFKIPASALP